MIDNGKVLGLVDSADVLTYALKLWRRHEKPLLRHGETALAPESEAGRKLLETPVREIIST